MSHQFKLDEFYFVCSQLLKEESPLLKSERFEGDYYIIVP